MAVRVCRIGSTDERMPTTGERFDLALGVRRELTVAADEEQGAVELPLDVAIVIPDGYLGLLMGTPELLAAGLRPALGVELVMTNHDGSGDPAPLRLTFHVTGSRTRDITLSPGSGLVRLLLLPAEPHRFIEDPDLALAFEPLLFVDSADED